jgi:DNA-binding transcriptional LysR family regulator
LEAFVAVAKAGSFTRAAETLHISQPALTVQIRQLEQTMGVRLLDRNTRTVRLTRIGQELSPIVQRLLREIEDLTHHAREMAAGVRGVVSVAVLPSVASTVLPQIIAEFREEHPGILIVLKDMPAQKVLALVKADEVDFGIGSFADLDPATQAVPLFADQLRIVFPRKSRLDRPGPVRLKDLIEFPLILMDGQSSVRMIVDRAFGAIGHFPAAAYEASYMSSAIGMVKAGLGIAFLPSSMLDTTELSGIASRIVSEPGLTRQIVAIHRSGKDLSPAAKNFLRILVAGCRKTETKPRARRSGL